MIENIFQRNQLVSLAKKKAKAIDIRTIHKADIEHYEKEGWAIHKELKSAFQVKRDKIHGTLLEDRVWSLFYKMKFNYLSGEGGIKLQINPNSQSIVKTQLDVLAIDDEIAVVIECKSSKEYKKRSDFQEELGKFSISRESIIKTIKSQFLNNSIRVVYIMFLSKAILTENDKERAKKEKVILFDEKDLVYYENLVNHLGPAGKYQVLADMLPGKEVPGLSIRIPAIKTKMGGFNCFTFSISPEYLLKISYVSHRSKGKASDIDTYQRMLSKSRLTKIREYISEDGIFPTNIVVNFEKGRLNFQRSSQQSETPEELDAGLFGWLDIKPSYKSAWIIDGQHRLFAYSGHDKALKSKLNVLAFEGLKPSKQAELFIDINAKQKSVKRSLLQELYAELHWDADDYSSRIGAIISKCIQDLNQDPESALFQRIQSTDGNKEPTKCLTLTNIFGYLEKKGFFINKEKNGSIIEYGPLWAGDDSKATLTRITRVLKLWINTIAEGNKEWWNIGAGPGGGLSMNDGIATFISILKSLFDFLDSRGIKLIRLSDQEICDKIKPYGEALANYLSGLNDKQRKDFRDLRGVQGVNYRTKQCQQGIRNLIPEFNPEGLEEWIELQKKETNKNAKEVIDKIEVLLQSTIVSILQDVYGLNEDKWWYEGIPSQIRQKVSTTMEEDKNKRGGKEYYFDLIHYKKIIIENWDLFENIFSFGYKGNKDKKTDYLDFINEIRKPVSHASSGKIISLDDYNKILDYYHWLKEQISKNNEAMVDN